MEKTIQKKTIARIEVQRSFCKHCGRKICQELLKIEEITNVILYPDNALVIFSFFRANDLCKALNVLTKLGYPEIGEEPDIGNFDGQISCNCPLVEYAA
ncbi:MAG: hypothetical protein AAF039_11615 [Bacteroidota bacterium]